jgi:cytoskeletal protein CcmA (bactofilin family)
MYFQKKQDPQQALACAGHAATLGLNNPKLYARSLLEASVKITGDLWSEGDVQIEGHLCGNINCAQLIVGKDAAVTGVIIAQEAVIRGKITGIIRARRVLLQDTAQVESEIIYRTLSVDEGARFEGVARPRLDPLQEEIAVSPMLELRQRLAPVEVAANGAGLANAQAASKAAAASASEPQLSVERSSAGGG